MARRPFFSGNYGSALGSFDTAAKLIAQAGQTQGQAMANIGAQVGGMIEQYGLNKEKQKENKATIKSSVGILERMRKLDPENETAYLQSIEQLNNEDVGLNVRAKLADRTLEGLTLTSRLAGEVMDRRNAAERIQASEDARKAQQKLSAFEEEERTRKENTYKAYEKQLDDLQKRILAGTEYDNLSVQDRFILGNSAGIVNRTLPIEKLIFDPSADLDFETSKQEFENIKKQGEKADLDVKMGEMELKEKEQETKRTPEFEDRDSALKSAQDLPEGVSANIKKYKDGFDVEYTYKAKEFTDIPSVPDFPNYKIVGGYVYEANPDTKKLTKLGSESFGEKSELLQKAIDSLTSKDIEQYSLAKTRGKQNPDKDYEIEVDGETITVPYNQDLENKLKYLDSLRNKLEAQIDLDLRTQ